MSNKYDTMSNQDKLALELQWRSDRADGYTKLPWLEYKTQTELRYPYTGMMRTVPMEKEKAQDVTPGPYRIEPSTATATITQGNK